MLPIKTEDQREESQEMKPKEAKEERLSPISDHYSDDPDLDK